MTDSEIVQAAKFSLLPLQLASVPSEAVLRECPGEPFDLTGHHGRHVTVWLDEEGFALSGVKTCLRDNLAHELFDTHAELVEAVQQDRRP